MNILLFKSEQLVQQSDQNANQRIIIRDARQLAHCREHLKLNVGDSIKVGLQDGLKGNAVVDFIDESRLELGHVLLGQRAPPKLPLILIVAMPRPKVLRRLVMDAVTLGVEQLILIHSYRVEKSYWQSPFLQQLDHYVRLGLEQAGDTIWPQVHCYKRFRPFVEDVLPSLIEGRAAYVAHPYTASSMPKTFNQPTVLVVGPEGGFIPFEVDLLQKNGCQVASLGSRILRTETAISVLLGRFS